MILATGANQGRPLQQLEQARTLLAQKFTLLESSRIYTSKAVDYENQPDFYNQVLLFEKPASTAINTMRLLLEIEAALGRKRIISRGPRTIDIDMIFFGQEQLNDSQLILPHPRFLQRSFVIRPMLELSIADWLHDNYHIPDSFDTEASPIV